MSQDDREISSARNLQVWHYQLSLNIKSFLIIPCTNTLLSESPVYFLLHLPLIIRQDHPLSLNGCGVCILMILHFRLWYWLVGYLVFAFSPLMTEFSGVLTVQNGFMKLFSLLIVITGSDDLYRAEGLFGRILLMGMGCCLPSFLKTDHSFYKWDTMGKMMIW